MAIDLFNYYTRDQFHADRHARAEMLVAIERLRRGIASLSCIAKHSCDGTQCEVCALKASALIPPV